MKYWQAFVLLKNMHFYIEKKFIAGVYNKFTYELFKHYQIQLFYCLKYFHFEIWFVHTNINIWRKILFNDTLSGNKYTMKEKLISKYISLVIENYYFYFHISIFTLLNYGSS